MKTVAIICEYNPFHNGHLYQIDEIRREFGENCRIVAIMSGNFVQRGEVAIADKLTRAKCAICCGVDLVLELPFPYSCASAEFFARSGVHIANAIGITDVLSFGSESGNIAELIALADLIGSDKYRMALYQLTHCDAELSYPRACQLAMESIARDNHFTFTPNNILALEYIKAIKGLASRVVPHTIKRCGSGYNESEITEEDKQSATAIRLLMRGDSANALDYVPRQVKEILAKDRSIGALPCSTDKLSGLAIGYFRLNPTQIVEDIHEAGGGLYNRLAALSQKANTFNELTALAVTKKYTASRIRRTILNTLIGVTSSDIRVLPSYTQVLAMNSTGREMLKEIRKHGTITVLTKPSKTDGLSTVGKRQKELSDKADSLYQLTKPTPIDGTSAITMTPFVKE